MPPTRADFEQAATRILDAERILVVGHVDPDPDALGSAFALGTALHRLGKKVQVSVGRPAEVPESMQHLDVEGLFVTAASVDAPELMVTVDAASVDRLVPLDRFLGQIPSIVIDHHITNPRFGDLNLVDAAQPANVILVGHLLDVLSERLGTDLIDAAVASGLYAGLVTDTGSFRRATPSTHLLAARLLEAGVNISDTMAPILETRPFGYFEFLCRVLGTVQLETENGRTIVDAVVTLADADLVRAEEVESVINVVRTAREAAVAVVLKQRDEQSWVVSLRSAGVFDVRSVAQSFGGGGHQFAAGCTVAGARDDVRKQVLAAVAHAPEVVHA